MIKSIKEIFIDAPCKINLHLGIGEKRPDGFHNIESLFACLALSDTLKFALSGKEGECILSTRLDGEIGEWGAGNGEWRVGEKDNLVYKAVSLFRERTGFKGGLEVFLNKHIPIGAGLGGGSSDAASTLLALNSLAGNLVSGKELIEMAALLGSDVPFFLYGGLAFVSGRGERIEPVKTGNREQGAGNREQGTEEASFLEKLSVVLVKPPFSSDTAAAYKLLDQVRGTRNKGFESNVNKQSGLFSLSDYLLRSPFPDPKTWPFFNDFLSVFLNAGGGNARAYQAILEDLRETGASFVSLSGSGSCCFGIFTRKKIAEKAAEYLAGRGNFVRLTFFLANIANQVVK